MNHKRTSRGNFRSPPKASEMMANMTVTLLNVKN